MLKAILKPCLILTVFSLLSSFAFARDWYVSAELGKGKKGTIEEPAKDLGNIISKLEEGDRVFIAEGVYVGRGSNGHDLINVPVEIYGGFSQDFSIRDPWGAHKTIFSGDNLSENFEFQYRLMIDLSKRRSFDPHVVIVDGIIVDNAARNRYATAMENDIVRTANPSTGQNATPGTGGIKVMIGKEGDIVVRNNIILNTAPSEGVFSIWGHQNSEILIENNLAVNNTGNGFALHSQWHPRDGAGVPQFTLNHNTSLFNHKYSAFDGYGGAGLYLEADTSVQGEGNFLGFNDRFAIDNGRSSKGVVFNGNLIVSSLDADYLEFDTEIQFDDIEDEADFFDDFSDNAYEELKVPVSAEWAERYALRIIIDRNAAESSVKASDTQINALRSMLGLNLEGGTLDVDSDVWLPRISLEDVLAAGSNRYFEAFGSQMPAVTTGTP